MHLVMNLGTVNLNLNFSTSEWSQPASPGIYMADGVTCLAFMVAECQQDERLVNLVLQKTLEGSTKTGNDFKEHN